MIILSRMLGIVRDQFQAFYFGIGFFATIWEIAIWIPGLLRNFLADGGLARVFITEYSRTLSRSKSEARELSGVVIASVSFFIVLLLIPFYWFAPVILPPLVNLPAEEGQLLVKISRITMLHLLLISPVSLMSRIFHTQKRFAFPSVLEASQNLLFLLVYISFEFLDILDSGLQLVFLAWALTAGGTFQLLAQIFYIRILDFLPKLNLNFQQIGIKKILRMMGPISLGLGAFHLNGFFDIVIASHFIAADSGAIPALRYASRLTALPLAIVSTALATTILPAISEKIAKRISDGRDELRNATLFALFLTVPASIGLMILGESVIQVLFERGEWDRNATLATENALQFLALSIPFVNVNNLLYTYFYAHQKAVIVMRVMITGVVFNLILNLVLVQWMAQAGLALSTTLSSMLVCILLSRRLLDKNGGNGGRGVAG